VCFYAGLDAKELSAPEWSYLTILNVSEEFGANGK